MFVNESELDILVLCVVKLYSECGSEWRGTCQPWRSTHRNCCL